MTEPLRGELWTASLDPTRGREQAGWRPVLVISRDSFNRGPSGLVVVLPVTSTRRGVPLHVEVDPPEAGLRAPSAILCDQVRTLTRARLGPHALGRVSEETLAAVEDRLRILLQL
jgi:mRNA interferase MazF